MKGTPHKVRADLELGLSALDAEIMAGLERLLGAHASFEQYLQGRDDD